MLEDFINSFKSINISSMDEKLTPFSSYAPFIKKEHKYYIYISQMAKHYNNLSENQKASIFFIEDEKDCENIFARRRAVLQCSVKKLSRDTKEFNNLIKIFEQKHGDTVKVLKKMKDFSFFEFTPFYGEAIFGFGKAYNIGGENFDKLVERENLKGHQEK